MKREPRGDVMGLPLRGTASCTLPWVGSPLSVLLTCRTRSAGVFLLGILLGGAVERAGADRCHTLREGLLLCGVLGIGRADKALLAFDQPEGLDILLGEFPHRSL